MALDSLITNSDATIINIAGIATAGLGIAAVLVFVAIIAYHLRCNPSLVTPGLRFIPTRFLYASTGISLVYSTAYILSCSSLSSRSSVCIPSMFFLVLCIHIMNGLSATILVHCSILVSSKNAKIAVISSNISCIFVVILSLALAITGVVTGRFGYIANQDTCWIIDAAPSPYRTYLIQAFLLYIPLFATLVLSLIAVAYIFYRLILSNEDNTRVQQNKSLVYRLACPPACLALHTLMVVGGDLPIEYHTRAGQFASYLFNYVGLGSFSIALALCVIFIDPHFNSIRTSLKAGKARSELENGAHVGEVIDIVQVDAIKKESVT